MLTWSSLTLPFQTNILGLFVPIAWLFQLHRRLFHVATHTTCSLTEFRFSLKDIFIRTLNRKIDVTPMTHFNIWYNNVYVHLTIYVYVSWNEDSMVLHSLVQCLPSLYYFFQPSTYRVKFCFTHKKTQANNNNNNKTTTRAERQSSQFTTDIILLT